MSASDPVADLLPGDGPDDESDGPAPAGADADATAKRERILDGAVAVFAADGYEGASMSRIAREAGVSKGSLYNYFDGKADLFRAFVERQCARNMVWLHETLDGDAEPAETLRQLATEMLRMLMSPAALTIYRVVISEAPKFPVLARTFLDSGPRRGIEMLAGWLSAETARGRLCTPDPVFAAEQFFALCQTMLLLKLRLGVIPAPEPDAVARAVEGTVAVFLHGYATPEKEIRS